MLLADDVYRLWYNHMAKLQNLDILIPFLNIQKQIIHKIAQLLAIIINYITNNLWCLLFVFACSLVSLSYETKDKLI